MSPGTGWGALVSMAFAADVSLVLIMWTADWARVSTPARQHF